MIWHVETLIDTLLGTLCAASLVSRESLPYLPGSVNHKSGLIRSVWVDIHTPIHASEGLLCNRYRENRLFSSTGGAGFRQKPKRLTTLKSV